MSKQKKKPEIKVVLDTSALYTSSESDLLNKEISKVISDNTDHLDIELKWYIPSIVIMERQFQMEKEASKLFPHIQKLEKLLGHNLAITESTIKDSIKGAIDKNIKNLGIEILDVCTEKIQWSTMIKNSLFRIAPFEDGKKEKGFRDALIAESFYQLVDQSPITPKICRIVFITGDNLLHNSVKEKLNERKNVRVLSSIEDLKGLIHTLVSEVDEEFINNIKENARLYFFYDPEDRNTLYYKENIREQISEKFSNVLAEVPEYLSYRKNGTWYVSAPNFVRKNKQIVSWSTKIYVEIKGYIVSKEAEQSNTQMQTLLNNSNLYPLDEGVISSILGRKDVLSHEGRNNFEVIWSASVSTSQKFSKPKVEGIKYISTEWKPVKAE